MSVIPDIPFSTSWVDINTVSGVSVGNPFLLQNKRSTWAIIQESDTAPSNDSTDGSLLSPMGDPSGKCYIQQGSGRIWIKSFIGVSGAVNINDGLSIQIDNYTDSPEGLYSGTRAMTVQYYDEANKKNGTQWAASRRLPAALNVHNLSIIKTGARPVDLKRREFAFSGEGVIADIFENPTYTGGVVDPVYNSNGMVPQDFDFQLLVGFTITGGVGTGATFPSQYGTQFAPTIYALGPKSNQSKGVPSTLYGTNYILAPNTSYLLVFYSIDAAAQDVAARVEGYNGYLDLPL